MNAREGFLRTLSFKPIDPPAFRRELGFWPQTINRWHSEGLPVDIPHIIMWGNEYFGIDPMDWLDINFSFIPPFKYEVFEEDERYIVARNERGIVTRALKSGAVDGITTSMDQYLDFPMKCREDFLALKKRYDPSSPDRYPSQWKEKVRILKDRDYSIHLGADGAFGFFMRLREWLGTKKACTVFYDDPKWAHEMLDFMAELFIGIAEQALTAGVIDWFSIGEDFAYNAGPFISPKMFREFFFKPYRRVIDFLKIHDVKIIVVVSDGDFRPLLPALIETGINCICPIEVASNQDVIELRKEYGHDLALMGGLDKRALAKGRKAIEAEVYRKVPPLLEDGGFIPHVDHLVPPDVAFKDFLYYHELIARIGKGRDGA